MKTVRMWYNEETTLRYIAITWDAIAVPPEALIPCCFYHSAYAYYEYLLIEESQPYEILVNSRLLVGFIVVGDGGMGDLRTTEGHA